VLLALNELFEAQLSREALTEIAEPIGSDIPFFLFQSAALCKGHGEMVSPLKLKRQFSILLLKADVCCLNRMGILALARFSRNFGDSL
jgi:4-diphosphocytidyl-2-C-methyl-D-erythritol kinase